MKKSPLMAWVGMISWCVTALASINVGLSYFGWNFFSSEFVVKNLDWLVDPLYWLIGISGLVSFIMFILACSCWCSSCNGSECGCTYKSSSN